MSRSPTAVLLSAAAVWSLASWPVWAADADEPVAVSEPGEEGEEVTDEDLRLYRRLSAERGGYARLLLSGAFGRGLRFNNPYRLSTQLGDDAESLSLTASYLDLGVAAAFGEPDGLQQGGSAHLSVALEGVAQQALSGSYLVLYRGDSPWLAYGRIGPVLLTTPDPNVGGEIGLGGAWFFTGALGISAELVGDLFYGAGTWEVRYSVIPIISAQAGLIVDFEVLP